jgi:NADH-quinone oxidoreductase subunit C
MADKTSTTPCAGWRRARSRSADRARRAASADAASHPSVAALRERFGDACCTTRSWRATSTSCTSRRSASLEMLRWLRDDEAQRYDLLLDVTAVDYGGGRPLEVVYQLWSIPHRRALRLKATLPLTALEIDSVTGLWKTADWLEREAYDLFGIHFRGHPGPAPHHDAGQLRRGPPAAEGFPAARPLQPGGADAPRAGHGGGGLLHAGRAAVGGAAAAGRDARGGRAGRRRRRSGGGDRGHAGRPNDEDWSLGTSGSAAGGAPGPEGAGREHANRRVHGHADAGDGAGRPAARDAGAAAGHGAGAARRAHAHQHRAAAPGDARRAAAGAGAGRRDRRQVHAAHRLPALELREARRVPHSGTRSSR